MINPRTEIVLSQQAVVGDVSVRATAMAVAKSGRSEHGEGDEAREHVRTLQELKES